MGVAATLDCKEGCFGGNQQDERAYHASFLKAMPFTLAINATISLFHAKKELDWQEKGSSFIII